ncbi:hypothetical protein N9H19_03155 [Flavobacteriales bacterium]|nr:hypothetical protein [Flavobacteriales bacterium]
MVTARWLQAANLGGFFLLKIAVFTIGLTVGLAVGLTKSLKNKHI